MSVSLRLEFRSKTQRMVTVIKRNVVVSLFLGLGCNLINGLVLFGILCLQPVPLAHIETRKPICSANKGSRMPHTSFSSVR